MRRALVALALAWGLAGGSAAWLAAQEATPAGARDRIDLAAMALDGNDLPAGYGYIVESYIPADQASAELTGGAISAEELARTGLRWFYESWYGTPDRATTIRTYVEEFSDAAGARAGFALLEDEARVLPDSDFEDLPGPDVGEEPSETSLATLESPGGEPSRQSVDTTFRIDRLLAGVAIVTTGSEPPDRQLAEELAAKLAERIEAVLAGNAPEGIDLDLLVKLLPVTDLRPSAVEGYLTAVERLGLVDPDTGALDAYQGGYLETMAFGEPSSDRPGPFLALSLTSFTAPDVASAVLDQADQLPVIAPGERVEGLRVPNTDAAVGYRFPSPDGEAIDGFRIVFVVGTRLATVEVWASVSAQAEALDLAVQQAACLKAEGPCRTVRLPASLTAQTR